MYILFLWRDSWVEQEGRTCGLTCIHMWCLIDTKLVDISLPPTIQATSPWPRRLIGFEEANSGDLLNTQITPFHVLAPIFPHFCLLSFLSYELSSFLPPPLLLSPLISYCASWRNVHMPRIWMKCHCSVCWKALCPLSSPLDMSEGRKGLHGRVIKSLSVKETQKDEERKGENPETIFNSDSPTVPPPTNGDMDSGT